MSFRSYVTFLIKNYNNKNRARKKERNTISSKWIGLIPFMLKWYISDNKK